MVLASCVIEPCIYIRVHDATTRSGALRGQFVACGTWLGIRSTGEVTPGADKGTKKTFGSETLNCQKKRALFVAAENTQPQRYIPKNVQPNLQPLQQEE